MIKNALYVELETSRTKEIHQYGDTDCFPFYGYLLIKKSSPQ